MRPSFELPSFEGEAAASADSALEETVLAFVEHGADERAPEEPDVIVPKETIKRLKRIALDTRCVLTCEDANWLLELAESLDGEKLPPTERAPQGYPIGAPA